MKGSQRHSSVSQLNLAFALLNSHKAYGHDSDSYCSSQASAMKPRFECSGRRKQIQHLGKRRVSPFHFHILSLARAALGVTLHSWWKMWNMGWISRNNWSSCSWWHSAPQFLGDNGCCEGLAVPVSLRWLSSLLTPGTRLDASTWLQMEVDGSELESLEHAWTKDEASA